MKTYSTHSQKIEEFILEKDDDWQEILFELRDFILHAHPEIVELFKYKTAFFSLKNDLCYLNLRADKSCIDVGFVQGATLEQEYPEIRQLLSGKELKSIRHFKVFKSEWNDTLKEALNQVLITAISHRLKG